MHDPDRTPTGPADPRTMEVNKVSGVFTGLGDIPPRSLVSVAGLARVLKCHEVTIIRMIKRGELPNPKWLGCRRYWTARQLLEHVEAD